MQKPKSTPDVGEGSGSIKEIRYWTRRGRENELTASMAVSKKTKKRREEMIERREEKKRKATKRKKKKRTTKRSNVKRLVS